MTTLAGRYYDGMSAAAVAVTAEVSSTGTLVITGPDFNYQCAVAETRWSDRLGDTRRFVVLPQGGTLEIEDNAVADEVVSRFGVGRRLGWVHFMERSWPIALLALVATSVAIWAGLTFGVPAVAARMAVAVPIEMETTMGKETLVALDGSLLEPSELDPEEQARVRALFDSLQVQATIHTFELRSAPEIGANAFALPSGIMVVTDELVELAESDNELLAVMAHEVGHIHHRHIMRAIIQNSTTALVLAGLLGDFTSIAGLSAAIPTFLMEAKHSREFELEADAFAADLLHTLGKDPSAMIRILRRLSEEHEQGETGAFWRYLSSHPATDERIKVLEAHDE